MNKQATMKISGFPDTPSDHPGAVSFGGLRIEIASPCLVRRGDFVTIHASFVPAHGWRGHIQEQLSCGEKPNTASQGGARKVPDSTLTGALATTGTPPLASSAPPSAVSTKAISRADRFNSSSAGDIPVDHGKPSTPTQSPSRPAFNAKADDRNTAF